MFIGLSASMIALRRSAMWVLSRTNLNSHAICVDEIAVVRKADRSMNAPGNLILICCLGVCLLARGFAALFAERLCLSVV